MRTIFIEGLDFDAAHFIPSHPKCGRLHGHTYQVKVTLEGSTDEVGMVVDFGEAKRRIKQVLDQFDHRLLVKREFLRVNDLSRWEIRYTRENGHHELALPGNEIYILEDHSTIEHITQTVAEAIWERLVLSVSSLPLKEIVVEITEGMRKGSIYTVYSPQPIRAPEKSSSD